MERGPSLEPDAGLSGLRAVNKSSLRPSIPHPVNAVWCCGWDSCNKIEHSLDRPPVHAGHSPSHSQPFSDP